MRWILVICLVLLTTSKSLYGQNFGSRSETDAQKTGVLAGVIWRSGLWSEILKQCSDRDSGFEVEAYLDGLEWFEAGQKYGRTRNWTSSTCTNARSYADQHIEMAQMAAKANRALDLPNLGVFFKVMDCQIGAFHSANPKHLMIFLFDATDYADLVKLQPQNRDEEKVIEKITGLMARDVAQDKEVRALKKYLVKSQNCYSTAISRIDIPELKTIIDYKSNAISELLKNVNSSKRSVGYLREAFAELDPQWSGLPLDLNQYTASLTGVQQESGQAFVQVFSSELQRMLRNVTKEFFGV